VWIAVESGAIAVSDLLNEHELAICPAIFHEVLRGANTSDRYRSTREMLLQAPMLDAPTPLIRFEAAAQLYLRCRDAGYTMTGFDCLIAACAIDHRLTLAHRDRDFDFIASVTALAVLRV
jgi:predicted nucleic acid-binding protein